MLSSTLTEARKVIEAVVSPPTSPSTLNDLTSFTSTPFTNILNASVGTRDMAKCMFVLMAIATNLKFLTLV